MPDDSEFCNRCGTKVKSPAERLRSPSVSPPPPPRPARRPPIIERRPVPKPVQPRAERPDSEPYRQSSRPTDRPVNRPIDRPVQPRSNQSLRPDYDDPDYEEQRQDEYVDDRSGKRFDPQGEEIIFRINPAFYPVASSYFVSIIGALLVAGAVAYLRGSFWIVLIFSVIFITPAIIRHIIFVQTIYTLTTVKIEVRTGLFSKNSRNIPLRHIQDVYVSETFKERMLGIGDVVIDTAATESKMSLDNINEPRKYADMILDQLHNWN